CKGCQIRLEGVFSGSAELEVALDRRNRAFSEEKFLAHFTECEEAQAMWELSKEGMV
ncbi:hypothetical protein BDD12DRAFT_656274, partial [Trichophaea hybrida]